MLWNNKLTCPFCVFARENHMSDDDNDVNGW